MTSTTTLPPVARTLREPAVVTPGRNTTARTRARAQWLVLAAALTVLAGMMVAWALTRAADRVGVVSLVRPIAAGAIIELDDLTTTQIAFEGDVQGLVPAGSVDAIVGRVATVDVPAGSLLSAGMWADSTGLAAGERTVGAVLQTGRFPIGMAQGSTAIALPIDDAAATAPGVEVRVVEADMTDGGELSVTLAAPEAAAAAIAQLAATDRLVLIGMPAAIGATP
jgi:hypothetical protein